MEPRPFTSAELKAMPVAARQAVARGEHLLNPAFTQFPNRRSPDEQLSHGGEKRGRSQCAFTELGGRCIAVTAAGETLCKWHRGQIQ